MLIELHSLTSHSPANLNRDDLGRPKSAVFGGVHRARISSQAIKRSVRTSNYFEENLRDGISTRSRKIPKIIYERLLLEFQGNAEQLAKLKELCVALPGVFGKADSQNPMHTSQIIFLTPDEVARTTDYVRGIVNSDEKLTKAKVTEFISGAATAIGLNRNPGDGVDMALFGRMTTDDANSFISVDAAMQVAHAISTHAVTPETDWFTAVDDNEERGSGHIGELEFNSATFYKYFSCNLPLLVKNMNGTVEDAVDALATVLDAACRVTPSGKQNSYASHAFADTVLLVIRQQRIPVSLANAFERPVLKNETAGYLASSRIRMLRHYRDLVESYSLKDRSICFCSDSEVREELRALLPATTQMVGSLKELFDTFWTISTGSTAAPTVPAARSVAPTSTIPAVAIQQTAIPSPSSLPSASPSESSSAMPTLPSNPPTIQESGTAFVNVRMEPKDLFDNQAIGISSSPNISLKRRGRPPKDPNAPPKPKPLSDDPNTPKRGRGRPPKDPNAPPKLRPEVVPSDPNAPQKRRGRPPKDPNAPPKPEALSNDPNAPKRGRGRPPKDPNAPPKPKPLPADPNAPKRGRGRPRKDAQTSPVMDEAVEASMPASLPTDAMTSAEPNASQADRSLTDGGSL